MQKLFTSLQEKIASKGLDGIPMAIFWVAKDGEILNANEKFCQERGYSYEEALRLHIRDINPLISTKGWRDYWKKVRSKGLHVIDTEHMNRDGQVFPVELRSNYIEVDGFEVIFNVVTPLLKRDKFRDLLEITSSQSKVVGWEWDRFDNIYTYTSFLTTLCNVGDSNENVEFRDLLRKIFSEKQDKEFRLSIAASLDELKGFELDFNITKQKGNEFWVRVTGNPLIIDDEVVKIQGTIQDISVHRDFSDEMYLLKYCMDYSDDQIFWTDDQGKLSYANVRACEILGYPAKQLYEKYVWEVIEMEKDDWFQSWGLLKETKYSEEEHIQKSKEGIAIPVKTKRYALQYEGKYYNLAIVRDIREEKKKEAQLQISLDRINELQSNLSLENTYLKEEILREHSFGNIISRSEEYKKVLMQIQDVAHTDATVLILGESGTGKELLATATHELSKRADKALIKVNCAALPENLIESELFGHEKGAFTGAYMEKMGRFELAHRGTIFLDEIGELPLDLQAKMLRVLQEGEFQRLGSTHTTTVDVRIIAATNKNLVEEVKQGRFREDLFFRLNVFPIVNLPLRERKDDIPLLAQHFLEKFSNKMHKPLEGISAASLKRLSKYNYPGNVRELENIIERAVIMSKGKILKLPPSLFVNQLATEEENKGWVSFDELQRNYIIKVLEHTNWKVSGKSSAAEILGMNGKTLYSRMNKLDISKP